MSAGDAFRFLSGGARWGARTLSHERSRFSPSDAPEVVDDGGDSESEDFLSGPPEPKRRREEELCEPDDGGDEDDGEDHVSLFSPATKVFHASRKSQTSATSRSSATTSNRKRGVGGAEGKLLKSLHLAPEVLERSVEVKRCLRKHGIRVAGNDVPAPVTSFSAMRKLGVPEEVISEITAALGEGARPTPVQMQAVPAMCAGREVIGVSVTGSGKTLAFVVPVLSLICKGGSAAGRRAVVLSPTKELARQTYRVFQRFSKGLGVRCRLVTGCGGGDEEEDDDEDEENEGQEGDVIVATPMRLVTMIKSGEVDLAKRTRVLVIDEADRLFDEHFVEQLDEVAAAARAGSNGRLLQTCLFSATMLPKVEQLATSIMRDPVRILVGPRNAPGANIKQKLVFVGSEDGKLLALRQLVSGRSVSAAAGHLDEGEGEGEGEAESEDATGGSIFRLPALVFVQSKERADELWRQLVGEGVKRVEVVSAQRSPEQRQKIVDGFRAGSVWVLIATDVVARGMDFRGVGCVVNYDFPQSVTDYVHRVGRTGRAGRPGAAITFFTEDDAPMLRVVANAMKEAGCSVPSWMLELKPASRSLRKEIQRRPPRRAHVAERRCSDAATDVTDREKRLLFPKSRLLRRRPSKKPSNPGRNNKPKPS